MRRRLALAGLIGLLLLAFFPFGSKPAVAAPRVSGKIVAREVAHSMPAFTTGEVTQAGGAPSGSLPSEGPIPLGADTGTTGEPTLLVTSPVLDAGQYFDRIGLHWIAARGAEGSLFVEMRTSADGATWSEWELLKVEEDMADLENNHWYAAPLPAVEGARYGQYRVWLTDGDPAALHSMGVTFIDVSDLNQPLITRVVNDINGALTDMARSFTEPSQAFAAPTGASRVLDRQAWAADEALMRWVPSYEPVQKAVVHHTVTRDGGTNVAAEIRSIYYFHAVTRGWGDIGYSYLVDKYGNIWTGRQGGDNAAGGHAFGWNKGTIGVAAIGDYSVIAPTSALQGAIANIIALKFRQWGIAPYGAGAFTHEEQRSDGSWVKVTATAPNVLGHRDCTYVVGQTGGQTACPGGAIYNMMDGLRRLAQNAWQEGYSQLVRYEPNMPRGGYPGQAIPVTMLLTNHGRITIPAGTSLGYRVYKSGVLVTQGAMTPIPAAIAPGATGAATAQFVAPAMGSYMVKWDLATGGAWWNTLHNTPAREMWFRSADWSADWISDNVSRSWTAGETRTISVTVKNDGGRTWPATGTNPVRLGYYWISTSTGNRFDSPTRVPLAQDVAPGQTVTLTIPVSAPAYPTNYTMVLDLEKQGEFWFRDKGLAPDDTPVNVGIDFKAQYALGSLPKFAASERVSVPVTITNMGRGTFPVTSSYPVNLGYHWYDVAGKTVLWDGERTKLPADLLAGQSVTLQAAVTSPGTGATYGLKFDLVQEGVGWFSNLGAPSQGVSVPVAGPLIASYGATYQPGVSTLAQSGGLTVVPFTITNTSNFTWSPTVKNPVTLSYHWANAAGQTLVWEGLRTPLPGDVAPGQSVTLQARVQFPVAQGTYTLRWDLAHEGLAWFSGKGVPTLNQSVIVGPPPFYGGSLDVSKVPATLPLSMPSSVPLRVQNLSNFAWDASVNLSYHWYDATGKVVAWDGVRTPLAGIRVQEVRAVDAAVVPPPAPGKYTLRFDIVREGVTWFSGAGMQLAAIAVGVEVARYAALYESSGTVSAPPNAVITVPVKITNVGSLVWQPGVVSLGYHLYAPSGNVYVWDGARTVITAALGTGQSASLSATVRLPASAGSSWTIRWDLVHEGVTWFSGRSVPSASTALVVQ